MAADRRSRLDEISIADRLNDSVRFRREVENEWALLNRLKPVHKPFIVGWVHLIECQSSRRTGQMTNVRVGLLCGVVITAACLLMDVRERGLDEAQQQSTRQQNGVRATH